MIKITETKLPLFGISLVDRSRCRRFIRRTVIWRAGRRSRQ